MSRIKTHSWAKKRFSFTKNWKWSKILHAKACQNHLITNKHWSNKTMQYGKLVNDNDFERIKRLFPNIKK